MLAASWRKQVTYLACVSLSVIYPTASVGSDQLTYLSDPSQLPGLLQQLVADLDNPAITYLLGWHYYDRTNHSRYRHFPAVFALRQGKVANVKVGHDFVAFDTEFVRYSERGELHGLVRGPTASVPPCPSPNFINSAAKHHGLFQDLGGALVPQRAACQPHLGPISARYGRHWQHAGGAGAAGMLPVAAGKS